MRFPYGLSDFGKLIREGYFYQDRTDRIPLLEASGDQLLFIRPRRFGKSLLLSMLECYYDLGRAEQFDALFGSLAIGRDPTPSHSRYFVMRWDFSLVKAQGEVRDIEAALHQHINDRILRFQQDYADHLTKPIVLHADNAISTFESALTVVSQTPHKLYLLIDEYDNFANEVLMAKREQYEALLYGEGLLKTVFKAVKAGAGGQGLDRVFITGVSPVVLSDMTSGYNVAKNIYLEPELNDLCGFTEPEIAAVLTRLASDGADWSHAEALDTMRTFYNGYRFSEDADARIYNPTLSLYFLEHLGKRGRYPRRMLDENLAMDRAKLVYIARLPHRAALFQDPLQPRLPLEQRAAAEDRLAHAPVQRPAVHDGFGAGDRSRICGSRLDRASRHATRPGVGPAAGAQVSRPQRVGAQRRAGARSPPRGARRPARGRRQARRGREASAALRRCLARTLCLDGPARLRRGRHRPRAPRLAGGRCHRALLTTPGQRSSRISSVSGVRFAFDRFGSAAGSSRQISGLESPSQPQRSQSSRRIASQSAQASMSAR